MAVGLGGRKREEGAKKKSWVNFVRGVGRGGGSFLGERKDTFD